MSMFGENKMRVGILRGGVGDYYNSSIKEGAGLIVHIQENLSDRWKPVDILIDKAGIWHIGGLPVLPSDLLHKVDIVWNCSHPSFSQVLENLSIPHIGASNFSFILEHDKEILRDYMKSTGIDIPRSIILPVYQDDIDGPRERYSIKKAKEIFEKFPSPWIVKSFTPDTTMGIHLAKTFPELVDAIEDGVKHNKSILVEEFIVGKVASMHSLLGFRDEDIYTFPVGNSFGNFSSIEKEKLVKSSNELRHIIDANHYLKLDFVMNPKGKLYLLGIKSTPNLKTDSHLSQTCTSVGAKPHNVFEHILEQAL